MKLTGKQKDLSLWLYEMALVCDAYTTKTLDNFDSTEF